MIVRDFFGAFSQPVNPLTQSTALLSIAILHYTLAYITLALLFIGFFSCTCKTSPKSVARIILPGFVLILIGPLLDLLLTLGHGTSMYYLPSTFNHTWFGIYFSFFGHGFHGISMGHKIEIALVLWLSFIYCRIKNQSILRSLVSTWLCYTLIFVFFASPCFVRYFLQQIHFDYQYSDLLMARFFFIGYPSNRSTFAFYNTAKPV